MVECRDHNPYLLQFKNEVPQPDKSIHYSKLDSTQYTLNISITNNNNILTVFHRKPKNR